MLQRTPSRQGKTNQRMGEYICKSYTAYHIPDKGLVSRILVYKGLNKKTTLKWAKDLNRHFSKDMQIANKHIKRCSTTLVIGEIQIEPPMRYYFTPTKMSIIKKTGK